MIGLCFPQAACLFTSWVVPRQSAQSGNSLGDQRAFPGSVECRGREAIRLHLVSVSQPFYMGSPFPAVRFGDKFRGQRQQIHTRPARENCHHKFAFDLSEFQWRDLRRRTGNSGFAGRLGAAVVSHWYEDPYLICRFHFPDASRVERKFSRRRFGKSFRKL